MDSFFLVLSVLALLCSFAYAFVLYEVLTLVLGWFRERAGSLSRVPLILRVPSRVASALLVLCFLAVVL